MSFQAKVDYTKSDFVAFSKVHLRTKMKKQRIVQLVCAAVCCLMEILLIVTTILYRVKDTTFIVLMVLMPILAAEMLLLPRINAFSMTKTYRKLGTIVMDFGEQEANIRNRTSQTIYQYSGFDSVYHSHGAYYLFINRQQALVIPERCFVEGDPAAFGAFLAEKTGLEVKELN